MESQSILLMAITNPHKLRETLLTATRPLVHDAAIGAIASLAPVLGVSYGKSNDREIKKKKGKKGK